MEKSLFISKFYPPKLHPQIIQRDRIQKNFQQGFEQGQDLILVSAPAGYGKSTAVKLWLQSQPKTSYVWISLDLEDDDPARFMKYIVAGLQSLQQTIGESVNSLLSMPNLPPLISIMDELLQELYETSLTGVVIFDDYHLINNTQIHQAVEYFIDYHPPTLKLIIITRRDPPFALSKLRASGLLREIRARDLQFKENEVEKLLNQSLKLNLSEESIKQLFTRTEGWAAGLQLSALAIQNVSDQHHFITEFSGTHHFIMEYLIDEVLKQQPEEIQDFLKKTAKLKYFNADLCNIVTGHQNAASILDKMEKTNLFLISLDDQHIWFRYHHLFSEMLQTQINSENSLKVHQKAAKWFESQNLFEDAIHHYLLGSETENAVRLISKIAIDLFKQGELKTLLNHLNSLPDEYVNSDQELIIYKSLCLVLAGKSSEAKTFISQSFSPSSSILQTNPNGRLLSLQAWFGMMNGDPETEKLAEQALNRLDDEDLFFRAITLISLGTSQVWNGKISNSNQSFREANQLGKQIAHPFIALGALANLAFNLWELGEMREAKAVCQKALDEYVDHRGKPLPILAIIYAPLSSLYYESGEFEKAGYYAQMGINIYKRLFSNVMMGGDNEIVLARLAFLKGDIESALLQLSEMEAKARQEGHPMVVYKMLVAKADIYLRNLSIKEAEFCINDLNKSIPGQQPKGNQVASHLQARLLIAKDKVKQAIQILDDLSRNNELEGCSRRIIGVQITQALAYQKLGDFITAKRIFSNAIQLAAPDGYCSPFLPSKGQDTLSMLKDCSGVAQEFMETVIELISQTYEPEDVKKQNLPDPMTEQELRVLKLIISGLSNQEIANELVITLGTAKWHVHNVLQKLGVESRAQAIVRAQEINLI